MPTGYIPILQIKTKDGKWLPVNAIGGQVASKVLYNNAYPTVEQALDYLFENGTGGGGGGTGGASTAANVSYTNTQLPNVKNVKGALDAIAEKQQQHEDDINALGDLSTELDKKSHTHVNKDTLDKLSNSNGKLQYNGSDVGLKGANGITPTIGANGNWYLDTTDTGKPSRGEKGDKGDPGSDANVTKANVITALGYTPKAVSAQVSTGTNITLADNTEYRLTDVTTLRLSYPVGDFECWMRLSFAASGDATVILPAGTKYIGVTPDFKNGETWELSFKDGIVAGLKVGGDGYSSAPVKGVDYWTEEDKQEIIQAVLAAMPDGTEVSY